MAERRIRTLRSHLIRLALSALAVLVGSLAVAGIAGYRAVTAWESTVADRAADIVRRTLAQQVRAAADAVEQRSYMSEPAGVVAGPDVETARRRLRDEETHFLAVRGYTFLLVANAAHDIVFAWSAGGAAAPVPALPPELYDRLDAGAAIGAYLRVARGIVLIGASRLHRPDGAAGEGYLVLGRPLDDAYLSAIDPAPEIHLGLRMDASRTPLPMRSISRDSTILREPLHDIFDAPIATVEARMARDTQHRVAAWGVAGFGTLFAACAVILLFLWAMARRLLVEPVRAAMREVESMRDAREMREITVQLPVAEFELLRGTFNQAVTSLGEFQRRYRDVFERAVDALFVIERATGRVVDANPATSALTGRAAQEMIGQLLPDELLPRGPGQRIVRWQRPDGVSLTWGVASSELQFEGGAWMLASYRDLTGREAMAHAQKMEAVGSLAGGIAHDFNNLMGAVLSGVAAARRMVAPGDPVTGALDGIERAGTRAAELTRQLLGFSRQEHVRMEPVDLGLAIATVRDICSHTFDRRISIDAFAPDDLPEVMGDTSEIEQGLLNLCINARDAMPKGGSLRLEARRAFFEATEARTAGAPQAGVYAVVTVTDTGVGMTDSVKSRIFEPYFTTKDRGKGTGLGLSLTYGVLRHLGGSITVQSAVGRGTQFTLFFPACTEQGVLDAAPASERAPQARPARKTPAYSASLPMARPTVLLVDDEHALREMLRMVLDLSGFRVIEAEDGTQALDRLRAHQADVRAVLLDVQLPGTLSGVETLERIRALDPRLPVILCSGFVRDDDMVRLRQLGVDEVLLKPVDLNALLEQLGAIGKVPPAVPVA